MFVENTPIVTGVRKNSNYCSEFGPIIEEDGIISRQKVFGKTILTGKFYLTFLIFRPNRIVSLSNNVVKK
jgi:hypothetical protein